MKRYVLRLNPELHDVKKCLTSMQKRYIHEKLVKSTYKDIVIPFAICNNLNYKRQEWQQGISLMKGDLVALTLILPPEVILKLDSE